MKLAQMKDFFVDDWSYKLVSFLVSLALWMTLITRQDMVAEQEVKLNYVMPPLVRVKGDLPPMVQVRVMGSRRSINRFDTENPVLPVDISGGKIGWNKFELRVTDFNIPQGIRILSINPMVIRVQLEEATDHGSKDENQ